MAISNTKAAAAIEAQKWRESKNKLMRVKLSEKQREFVNSAAKATYFRSANQSGKSYSEAVHVASTALGRYAPWYTGWRPKLRTDGAYEVVIWVLSKTGQVLRDAMQTHLLGDV